jgi:hypothetical protein
MLLMSVSEKTKVTIRQRLLKSVWRRVPIFAVAFMVVGIARGFILLFSSESRSLISASLYALPWFLLAIGGLGLLIWRIKVKESPFTGEKAPREPGSRKKWILWALGIRTPGADAEYGETLARYRKWSSLPVAVMSMAVFILIFGKIYYAYLAIKATMETFNEATVVAQYLGGMSEGDIILDFMGRMADSVLHASPLWLQLPLLILWLLAFVIDFIVAASLATNKKRWWRKHWGGIITAIVTLP